jgi:sugar lactone lactonase YvrE
MMLDAYLFVFLSNTACLIFKIAGTSIGKISSSCVSDPTGKVYHLAPNGKLDMLVENGVSPNGLALSPDEKFLFVAMTRANAVRRLPLYPDGTTSKAGVFFQSFGTPGPDSLAMDEEGNLFICHPSLGSVFVIHPDGTPHARIVSGSEGINLENCCFGGKDRKTLYITDSLEGNVKYVNWHCKGAIDVSVVGQRKQEEEVLQK